MVSCTNWSDSVSVLLITREDEKFLSISVPFKGFDLSKLKRKNKKSEKYYCRQSIGLAYSNIFYRLLRHLRPSLSAASTRLSLGLETAELSWMGRRDPVRSVYVTKADSTGGHAYKQQSKRAISCSLSINLPLFWIFPLRRGSPKRIRIVKCPSVALFLRAYKAYKTNRLGIYQYLKLGWNLRKWYHILPVSLLKYFIVVNLIDLVLAVRESQQVFNMHNPPTL